MRGLWEYLGNVNWGDEEDIEARCLIYTISVIGSALFWFFFIKLFDHIGFMWWLFWLIGTTGCLMGGMVYIAFLIEWREKEKQQRLLEEARQWNPPNVYSDNTFVDDERLGGQHK